MNRLIALLLVLAFAAPARAQPIDLSSGGPINITARDGFEVDDPKQTVIANGQARAVRGDVTVDSDRLLAYYRKKNAAQPPAAPMTGPDTGGTEVYRIEAQGNVQITTPTDRAIADRAIYDIDQAVLLLTGHALRLTTPQQVMTARDSMEYWSQKHVAVGRGNAVVTTSDGRRISADTLVGYTAAPAESGKPAPAGGPAAGKLEKVEAFGNVEVRTAVDTVRGDRAIYLPETGIARIIGNVRITHGQNQINGPAADVNMKTGIAHMVADPGGRVQGLIMPNDATGTAPGAVKAAPTR